jgi:hypothetical protein
MPNGMTTGSGEVQEYDEEVDSDLLCELHEVLERHEVPEGLREAILDMIRMWEIDDARK